LLLLAACTNNQELISGIDWAAWKSDRNGCLNHRAAFIDTLRAQRNQLQSLTEMEIVKLLGKPDLNELYLRNQKLYSYFLVPSPLCDTGDPKALRLVIRFNAVSMAKTITVEEYSE
jgi:hypothetical protein